jgi:uncharacterized cupin superfamily protein
MVYFIRAGDMIKIGFARSESAVRARYATIRNASPLPVVLLGAMEGSEEDEKLLHRRFQAHRTEGEWFVAAPELLEVVEGSVEVRPAPGTRLSFRCGQDLVERVDAFRGREPREAFLRRVVEQALGDVVPRVTGAPSGVSGVPGADESLSESARKNEASLHAYSVDSGQSIAPAESRPALTPRELAEQRAAAIRRMTRGS